MNVNTLKGEQNPVKSARWWAYSYIIKLPHTPKTVNELQGIGCQRQLHLRERSIGSDAFKNARAVLKVPFSHRIRLAVACYTTCANISLNYVRTHFTGDGR